MQAQGRLLMMALQSSVELLSVHKFKKGLICIAEARWEAPLGSSASDYKLAYTQQVPALLCIPCTLDM